MRPYFLTALLTTASLVLLSSAGYAATESDDGFGGSTYFTAQTPDALGDTPTGNALASTVNMDNDTAESVSRIEPAAGGADDFGVFTLPEDPSAPVAQSGEKLTIPAPVMTPAETLK